MVAETSANERPRTYSWIGDAVSHLCRASARSIGVLAPDLLAQKAA